MKKHKKIIFDKILSIIRKAIDSFPDNRGSNNARRFELEDILLSAFALFFFQSSSWLEFQKKMENKRSRNNAKSLFGINDIPSEAQIRKVIDELDPQILSTIFEGIFELLVDEGIIKSYNFQDEKTLLIAIDGTEYFSSKKIHCPHCSTRTKNDKTTYSHSSLVCTIVNPDMNTVLPLMPEFIRNEDGDEKQDCEINAAKRWLKKIKNIFKNYNIILLGDDLYAHQPFIQGVLKENFNYITVCKETSHKTIYDFIETKEVEKHNVARYEKHKKIKYYYRYLNGIPINKKEDITLVNWCEVTAFENGEKVYFNSFITNIKITDENVESIAKAGRTRWKIENENNNVLKNGGYNLTHNYGHGKNHLSEFFFTLNLIAFSIHTTLLHCDIQYKILYEKIGSRKVFFQDLKTLTKYVYFKTWNSMIKDMIDALDDKNVIKIE